MKIILTYTGSLKSNGNAKHKHELRNYFSPQIKKVTELFPGVKEAKKYTCFFQEVNKNRYYQLINKDFHLLVDLQILMLRQGPLGGLVKGGDIDNRLKTLLDSLTVPDPQQADKLEQCQDTIYCLLENDNLISSISVHSEPILNLPDTANDDYVDLTITVNTRFARSTIENIDFL